MRRLFWLALVMTSGCIDLEGAYFDCVDGGRCASADAGTEPTVDGGDAHDAGIDAGFDAGGFDAGYDGGPRCASSPHARLRCDPPIELVTGSAVRWGALAPLDGGFVAAWVGASIEVRRVGLDRSTTTLLTGVTPHDGYVSIDGRGGDAWAAAWTVDGGAAARCQRDGQAASAVRLRDGGVFRDVSVAVNGSGGVALAGVHDADNRTFAAQAVGACPGELARVVDEVANASAVVSTSDPGGDGFRFLWSNQINAYNGAVNMYGELADGGAKTIWTVQNSAPWSIGARASTSGAFVLTATAGEISSGTRLDLALMRADLKNNGTSLSVDGGTNLGWWNVATCGDGCFAVGRLKSDAVGPAVVSFYSDAPPLRARGTWDAVCDVSATRFGTTVSVAGVGARLGVLVTTSGTSGAAKLYVCDVPPLE